MKTIQLSNAQILTILIALKRFAYDNDKGTITKKELLDIVKDILKEW